LNDKVEADNIRKLHSRQDFELIQKPHQKFEDWLIPLGREPSHRTVFILLSHCLALELYLKDTSNINPKKRARVEGKETNSQFLLRDRFTPADRQPSSENNVTELHIETTSRLRLGERQQDDRSLIAPQKSKLTPSTITSSQRRLHNSSVGQLIHSIKLPYARE
jgi:hypothetical protein